MLKYEQKSNGMMRSDGFEKNSSGFSGSSQERNQRETKKSKDDDDQKSIIIKDLRAELEKYKQRCLEL